MMFSPDTIFEFNYVELVKAIDDFEIANPGIDSTEMKKTVLSFFQSSHSHQLVTNEEDLDTKPRPKLKKLIKEYSSKMYEMTIHLHNGSCTVEIEADSLKDAQMTADAQCKLGEWGTVHEI